LGDATAFGRVMTHFEVLKEAVRQEEGTLVKTIGDSVMAVFFRPVCALRALVQVQKKIAAMGLSLKAGLHAGACMAVNLNERLDYFGSTVNIAARLGSLSSGENVVISSTIFNDPDVQSWLKSYPEIRYQPLEASLKGLENESFSLYTIHA
jgi:class 3 adenylate cyclase